jgi:multidrug efflux pump subunit AcrA (membrane-fusion protein)
MKNYRIWFFLIIVLFLFLFSACSKGSGNTVDASTTRNKPVSVKAISVQSHDLHRPVESVGSLFPYEEVVVSSEVEGKVERVLVDVGDKIAKGQPLVRISPTELQLTSDQQQATLEQARAKLGLGEKDTDIKDVSQVAEVKKAAADLYDAEQNFKRTKELFDKGVIPQQSYDVADARLKTAKANYDLAVQQVQNMRATIRQYSASADLAKKKLKDTTIAAPFGGFIKERTVAEGQYLKVQTPVVTIVDVDPLRVRLNVPEKMATWIKNGQLVTLTVEAIPGRDFKGKIWRINPVVQQQTRMFEVEALIENHDFILKPGFFVKASFPSDKVDSILTVPQEAPIFLYGVYKVFVIENGTLREREIKLGEKIGNQVEVISGLNPNDVIAIGDPAHPLREGQAVEAAK